MKKADIKTGFLCNNNCLFCVQGDQKKALGNKSEHEIKKAIQTASEDCDIIVFTGGEVTLRDDCIDLVRFASQFSFKTIQIQTNGRMFCYKDFCTQVIDAGANEFALALHGHIPELHNYLTQSKSFAQTVAGIKNLKALGQRVLTNTVITKSNYRHLTDITKLLISLDVDNIQLAFAHALGAAGRNFDSVIARMSFVRPHIIQSIKIARHFGVRLVTEAVPYCLMSGYEDCIAENIMPAMKIFEYDHIVSDFKTSRLNESKAKGVRCPECLYDKICEGPWKEYPQVFGWNEFVPVKKKIQ